MKKTLFDKIWDAHVVKSIDKDMAVIYIDRHFIHEVTSPQAFNGLRERGLSVFRTKQTTATADHNVPTINQHLPIKETLSRNQVETLTRNCNEFGIELFGLGHKKQGIVHVIGPEQGLTQPGMTIVCGDSHTSTHGAFGNIAFGIGTSQVEHVLASQCLILNKPKSMRINITGKLGKGVLAKDIILYVLSKLGSSGGTGFFIEYAGDCICNLSMEGRMTICNMSIELGSRGGLIQPDQTTFEYLRTRMGGVPDLEWKKKMEYWQSLYSDDDATFDEEYTFNAENISPMVTYGTNPGMGINVEGQIPEGSNFSALEYMGFQPGQSLLGMKVQHVFIGSCTNSRIEDLRIVANYVKGKKKADGTKVMIVPGSQAVRQQAIHEGLDIIFQASGFELREPGCSACLGMNEDKIPSGEYCVSTSNRNFEGRQGKGARTILASPLTAAAAAIEGRIVNVGEP